MKFLLDENVSAAVATRLRDDGHTVLLAAEFAAGAPDEFILSLAEGDACILVTEDKDFGEIVFRRSNDSGGVILVRLRGNSPASKAGAIADVVRQHGEALAGAFAVISPGRVRIRRRF